MTNDAGIFTMHQALLNCLDKLGKVDLEYISEVMSCDTKTVIHTLDGSIFFDPEKDCWVTAAEYLSGNLQHKLDAAKAANKQGQYNKNIDAISCVMPLPLSVQDIHASLGSPWIPADIIDSFLEHLLGEPYSWVSYKWSRDHYKERCKTEFDKTTGEWYLPLKKDRYDRRNVAVNFTYGTKRIDALSIVEKTLNNVPIAIKKKKQNSKGKTVSVLDKDETAAALEKQNAIINEFGKWIWSDSKRRDRLTKIYNKTFGCIRKRRFDGSFLTFPGMSEEIELYPYQRDAVARMVFSRNSLLAHEVGSGKTYEMIAAGMKMRSMGLSKKNMYVVPNGIVGQWERIFKQIYPNANILLCIDPKKFGPKVRQDVLRQIRDGDYDGIIIAYSSFELIPLSNKYYTNKYKREKEKLAAERSAYTRRIPAKLERLYEKTVRELLELLNEVNDEDRICFDDLGITRLFIDEAHNFKNLPFDTSFQVLGVNSKGSKKCQQLLEKIRCVQSNGGGVVLATGTPITNSISDAYVMQVYLQSEELTCLGLNNFSSWSGMFARIVSDFEIDVDTSSYRLASRFSAFHNLPELGALLSEISDFHKVDRTNGIPQIDGRIDILVERTKEFIEFSKSISERADKIRSKEVERKIDNLLKLVVEARKAAIDMRFVDENAEFSEMSKVARCAENVARIYKQTASNKLTQLIFSDIHYSPVTSFNLYDELRGLLINAYGVPDEQIAVIHEAETEAQKNRLFDKVRNGEIRILIGSTFKLGLGVNVQDRLIALHHIDVPWRPADMTQREGRILRQGNINEKVFIYRYVTQGSFDAYSWQLLEKKERFISSLISGELTERSASDIEDTTVLDYAQVKALALNDPRIKQRVQIENELMRYKSLQKSYMASRNDLWEQLLEIPAQIKHIKEVIEVVKKDYVVYTEWRCSHSESKRRKNKENRARSMIRDAIINALKQNKNEETELMQYHGFRIIIPATADIVPKPYISVRRNGSYRVELGDLDKGNHLIRVDNLLDSLGERVEKLNHQLEQLESKEKEITAELDKPGGYVQQIKEYTFKLHQLDKELGIDFRHK